MWQIAKAENIFTYTCLMLDKHRQALSKYKLLFNRERYRTCFCAMIALYLNSCRIPEHDTMALFASFACNVHLAVAAKR